MDHYFSKDEEERIPPEKYHGVKQVYDKVVILRSDDGTGGDTAYITLDGSAGYNIFSKHIRLLDDVQLDIGTSDDFRIVHTSANNATFMYNYTGDLNIINNADDKDIVLKSDDGSGGVTAYITLDGSEVYTKFSKNTRHMDNV